MAKDNVDGGNKPHGTKSNQYLGGSPIPFARGWQVVSAIHPFAKLYENNCG
jgi:hypothetical protein